MKKNKEGVRPVKPIAKPLLFLLASLAVISLASILLISYIWKNLKASGYFTVDEVVMNMDSAPNLSYLKGRNMFDIDLDSESRRILEFAPNCCNVRLVRVLPNRIYAEFVERTPIAFVRLHQYFAVDDDAVLFYSRSSYPEARLPLIVGLESRISGPKAGRRYPVSELSLAIDIIKQIKKNRILKNIILKKIDVSSPANTTLYIPLISKANEPSSAAQSREEPEGIEIKLGNENIGEKITVLASLLAQTKNDIFNIKYVDLRFKEPVIKFRDAKAN